MASTQSIITSVGVTDTVTVVDSSTREGLIIQVVSGGDPVFVAFDDSAAADHYSLILAAGEIYESIGVFYCGAISFACDTDGEATVLLTEFFS